jgi:hypothetical protein
MLGNRLYSHKDLTPTIVPSPFSDCGFLPPRGSGHIPIIPVYQDMSVSIGAKVSSSGGRSKFAQYSVSQSVVTGTVDGEFARASSARTGQFNHMYSPSFGQAAPDLTCPLR